MKKEREARSFEGRLDWFGTPAKDSLPKTSIC